MDVRRSAVDLSPEARDRFLEALIRLKHRPAPGGPAGASVYDQFVALHGAVFAVLAPGCRRATRSTSATGTSGSAPGVGWPPTAAGLRQLQQLVLEELDGHPFWYFWLVLEQGHQRFTTRTHNRGHNFIGGHMATGFSPNDPVFWLHHANVDRLWANWQVRRLAEVPGSAPQDHYPPPGELSPLDGDPAPPGHRLDDQMWPWVGGAPGFDVEIDPAVKPLLPDFSGGPAVTVREMLDTATLDGEGYRYAAPGEP